MKFDFAIGNPPYQDETVSENDRKPPLYHLFMDAAYEVADVVELITPARFLFEAGQTPKQWNEKMLSDKHFKVLHYESDATKVFSNTDIKGGVSITLRNAHTEYGEIGTFSPYKEMNSIYKKVKAINKEGHFMDSIVSNRGMYRLSGQFYTDYPQAASRVGSGTGNMIVSNIFEKIPEAFSDSANESNSIVIFGRASNRRIYKFINAQYVITNEYLDKYKLFFPEANSSGKFGETLTLPEIGKPNEGSTDTFINIGKFSTIDEAENLLSFIKTKFMRALLGIRKATQHSPKSVWTAIPLQDFTQASDIDWSTSISEIDHQLYKKYGLSQEEISFIENNVKEMK